MDSPFAIYPLGSGSRGNATVFAAGDELLLVDAGFSRRELERRMRACGLAPERVAAVLLTHEHDDHAAGCRVFCDSHGLPLYLSGMTCDALAARDMLPERVMIFSPGVEFAVGKFKVRPFPVSHDAAEPVGFIIRRDGYPCKAGMATDLGVMESSIADELTDCDVLVLESNYSETMLEESERTPRLKRRIRSFKGHLGNDQCMEALPELVGERTRMVYFAHVSRECNEYSLVAALARDRIGGRVDFAVEEQDAPARAFDIIEGRLI